MSKAKAFKGSIKKWEDICNSDEVLGKVNTVCAMCQEYSMALQCNDDDFDEWCKYCPLVHHGHGCLKKKSNWNKINTYIETCGLQHKTLAEIGNRDLERFCQKQLQIIKMVARKEGIRI